MIIKLLLLLSIFNSTDNKKDLTIDLAYRNSIDYHSERKYIINSRHWNIKNNQIVLIREVNNSLDTTLTELDSLKTIKLADFIVSNKLNNSIQKEFKTKEISKHAKHYYSINGTINYLGLNSFVNLTSKGADFSENDIISQRFLKLEKMFYDFLNHE